MNSNDKISVGLELDTSNFKAGIQSALQSLKGLADKLKTNLTPKKGKVIDVITIDGKQFNVVKKTQEEIKNNQKNINEETNECNENLKKQVKSYGAISGLVHRIGMSIRRQIITSIASALNPLNNFRKAFSYLTEVLSPRLGATFKNIGNNLTEYIASSKAFQTLVNWMLKAVYYAQGLFNILARIFGWKQIDLFKMSKKSAKEIEKSASRTTASFDEINDIGSQGQNGDNVPMAAGEIFSKDELATMDKNLAKIEEKIKGIKDNWIDWLKKIAIGVGAFILLKSIISGIFSGDISKGIENMFSGFGKAAESIAILGGIALVISSITELLQTISDTGMSFGEIAGNIGIVLGELAGAFLVFMGVMTLLEPSWKSIASAVIILGGLALVLKQLNGLLKTAASLGDNATAVFDGLTAVLVALDVLVGLMIIAGAVLQSPAAMAGVLVVTIAIVAILEVLKDTLPTILDSLAKFINDCGPTIIKIIETISNGLDKIIKALGTSLPPIIDSVGNLFEKIFKGVSKVIDSIGNTIVKILKTVDNTVGNVFDHILDFIERLGPAINTLVDNIIAAVTKVINFFVSGIEYLINTIIIKPINKLINKVSSGAIAELLDWAGIGKLKTIGEIKVDRFVPKLATGTNYVPNDQLAMIHKGEAVIPKKFNDREYFGTGNEDTNILLETLIDRVDNLELSPYITVKDIGQASVDYINNKTRITGRSVI